MNETYTRVILTPMVRLLSLLIPMTLIPLEALGCSCFCVNDPKSTYVSDLMRGKTAVLVTPLSSTLVKAKERKPDGPPPRNTVSNTYLVLDDLGQNLRETITINGYGPTSSCYTRHEFERSYFVSIRQNFDGAYELGRCSCLPDYFAGRDYVATGQDYSIHEIFSCLDEKTDAADLAPQCADMKKKYEASEGRENREFVKAKLKEYFDRTR